MAASAPNNMPHDPRPTGDLEHLFRQTFAEAEIQPRTNLWEQLDHELLAEQNDTYRKRLAVHRWVAAACLLLALGFGGWVALRQFGNEASTELAAAPGAAGARSAGAGSATEAEAGAARRGTAAAGSGGLGQSASAASETNGMLAAVPGQSGASASAEAAAGSMYSSYASTNSYPAAGAGSGVAYENGYSGSRYASAATAGDYSGSRTGISYSVASQGPYGGAASQDILSLAYLQSRLRNSLGLGLPDTLKPSLLARPTPAAPQLAAVAPEPEQPQAPKLWHRLRLGGSYAASSYNPNINFSQADGRQNADAVTMALNRYYREDAETEYRRNLRPGLGQRIAVTVDYALSKTLSLGSGVEIAEQRATSATSYGFLDGQQLPTGITSNTLFRAAPSNYAAAPPMARATSFRYRSVGVPVMLQVGSGKAGASLYAKVGAAVNLLLSTRSELDGSPEATRTYTRASDELPYRKVLTSVRGGAGVRFRPATATWSMAVGPVAEAGLSTLNAHPNQATLHQSRPYSFGIEARVDFGAARPVVALR